MRGTGPIPYRPYAVRFMDPEHLPYVVREHLRLFPDGFFARLGPRFLSAYTGTYMTSPHALAFIAVAKERPVGFLVGVTDPALHRRHMLRRHGGALLIRALGGLAVRPALLGHFLRTRAPRYLSKLTRRQQPDQPQWPTTAGPQTSRGPGAVLAHIAVDESARSLGIGADLVERFVAACAIAGCARVSLVTVEGPGGAGPYYERRGWRREGESRTPEGRGLLTYERVLETPSWPPGWTREETGEPHRG
ncbi:GNAT family N-acetyltransferase [Streptomyces sp. NPDC088124]|uniref:GNAT family N-acetyltransferase n=1 Tax=Streptomyces sp. NPDC088124 TaxID=3154654 RepID=UPI00342557AC